MPEAGKLLAFFCGYDILNKNVQQMDIRIHFDGQLQPDCENVALQATKLPFPFCILGSPLRRTARVKR